MEEACVSREEPMCAPTEHQPTQCLLFTDSINLFSIYYMRDARTMEIALKVFLVQPGRHTCKSASTIQYTKSYMYLSKGQGLWEKKKGGGLHLKGGRVEDFLGRWCLGFGLSIQRWEIFSQSKKVVEGRKGDWILAVPFLCMYFHSKKEGNMYEGLSKLV